MPTCNPKLKYSHAITHDATTLKRPRPTVCRSRAAEIFNFRLIRSDSIARNFISCGQERIAAKHDSDHVTIIIIIIIIIEIRNIEQINIKIL